MEDETIHNITEDEAIKVIKEIGSKMLTLLESEYQRLNKDEMYCEKMAVTLISNTLNNVINFFYTRLVRFEDDDLIISLEKVVLNLRLEYEIEKRTCEDCKHIERGCDNE